MLQLQPASWWQRCQRLAVTAATNLPGCRAISQSLGILHRHNASHMCLMYIGSACLTGGGTYACT